MFYCKLFPWQCILNECFSFSPVHIMGHSQIDEVCGGLLFCLWQEFSRTASLKLINSFLTKIPSLISHAFCLFLFCKDSLEKKSWKLRRKVPLAMVTAVAQLLPKSWCREVKHSKHFSVKDSEAYLRCIFAQWCQLDFLSHCYITSIGK